MVRLATVRSTFHARVIAARLGAEGITAQLRGNVDGVYPMGDTHVYVEADGLPRAQDLVALTAELPADDDEDGGRSYRTPLPLVLVVIGVAAMAVISLARVLLS